MAWIGTTRAEQQPDPPPGWAPYFKTLERYDRFEAEVRRYFKAKGIKVLVSDGVVTASNLGGPDMRIGLGNLSQLCAQSEEAEWAGLVREHFDRMARSDQERKALEDIEHNFEAISPRLALRLYEPGHVQQVLSVSVSRQDVPGLVTMLCIDMPDSVHTVLRERANKWHRADDELFEIARANTRRLIDVEPQEFEVSPGCKIWVVGGDSLFNASILLFPDLLEPYSGRHGGFVSIPTRSLALAIPLSDAPGLQHVAALMHFTEQFERDGPGSLSRRVWWYQGDRRIELPYESTDRGIEVHAPDEFQDVIRSME